MVFRNRIPGHHRDARISRHSRRMMKAARKKLKEVDMAFLVRG